MPPFSEVEKKVLNGFSIEEIELKLRPENEKNKSNCSSRIGFLDEKQNLIDVVKEDYDFLKKVGLDYNQMANLANLIFEKYVFSSNSLKKKISFIYDFFPNLKPLVHINENKFEVGGIGSFGDQFCPFGCKGRDNFGYIPFGSGHVIIENKKPFIKSNKTKIKKYSQKEIDDFVSKFKEKLNNEIEEDPLNLERKILNSAYLVITQLTPHLIASHYFFQGGAYRTDPEKLLEFVNLKKLKINSSSL